MTKEQLYALIDRMRTSEEVRNSSESTSWLAYREAQTLKDPSLFPTFQEIIAENNGEKKKEVRRAIYFAFGKILKNSFDKDACAFFLHQLTVESDKYILSSMLELLTDIVIPEEMDIEPILSLSKSDKWLIRHSAINALGSSATKQSKEALAFYLCQSDEKQYKYEIIYANASLGKIGTVSDIPLLEQHLHSRSRDIRESAKFAIERINRRNLSDTTR